MQPEKASILFALGGMAVGLFVIAYALLVAKVDWGKGQRVTLVVVGVTFLIWGGTTLALNLEGPSQRLGSAERRRLRDLKCYRCRSGMSLHPGGMPDRACETDKVERARASDRVLGPCKNNFGFSRAWGLGGSGWV